MSGQDDLQTRVRTIAAEAHGQVSVACALPQSTLNCNLNANAHPPMQSVFKLPLAMLVLSQIERGRFKLDEPVHFRTDDRILPHVYSPLQDKYPAGDVDVPLRELLRLAVSLSDNVAADMLLRITGGPQALDAYVASLGVQGFHVEDNERGLHAVVAAQYRNWFAPSGAVTLLRLLADRPPLTAEHTALLLGWMETPPHRPARLQQALPQGVHVEHKTGTSDVDAGLAHATNDIALITLPDGRKLAVAVFITDSTADEPARTKVIAAIGRAVYDAALKPR